MLLIKLFLAVLAGIILGGAGMLIYLYIQGKIVDKPFK